MDESDPSLWFRDTINPAFVQLHRFREIIYSGETRYQSVEVIDTDTLGRCLVLDGKLQSAENDEFIYHESLVQPGLIAHAQPRTVFVAGGGEGATVREVLRHNCVEKVVMVDIDGEAVDICRQHLPCMNAGVFDDPRLELLHQDAREYLANTDAKFDAVIMDITDPLDGGPAYMLYTEQFYRLVNERLAPEGIVAVQSGSASLGDLNVFLAIHATLKAVFPLVFPYYAFIPSFGGHWGFNLAARDLAPFSIATTEVDNRITTRFPNQMRFYDSITHRSLFCLPLYLRRALDNHRQIITDENPIYFHQG